MGKGDGSVTCLDATQRQGGLSTPKHATASLPIPPLKRFPPWTALTMHARHRIPSMPIFAPRRRRRADTPVKKLHQNELPGGPLVLQGMGSTSQTSRDGKRLPIALRNRTHNRGPFMDWDLGDVVTQGDYGCGKTGRSSPCIARRAYRLRCSDRRSQCRRLEHLPTPE